MTSTASRASLASSDDAERSFRGTARFEILRKLGEGGMGVVYEALDHERGSRLALKTLPHAAADPLLSFKAEFRGCQHLDHPNLVQLGELYEEGGVWFFTMELVDGLDFVGHIRRRSAPRVVAASAPTMDLVELAPLPEIVSVPASPLNDAQIQKLRGLLVQLALGLKALHDAGKVHRDIKPSNVLVTADDRVVILDFGLTIDAARTSQLHARRIVGTPVYMAPEQAVGKPVGPAADWYAVGVLLYETLTGVVPFEGKLSEVLEAKLTRRPVFSPELREALPADLVTLCSELLALKPAARPDGRDVLARLGYDGSVPPSGRDARSFVSSDAGGPGFVGRGEELARLRSGLDEVRSTGQSRIMYVLGHSGIGKSALVEHFVAEMRLEYPEAVVLSSRCFEHESVPYKAVDGIVDMVSSTLSAMPKELVAGLLPRHPTLLAQAFPVLWQVEALSDYPRNLVDLDPLELRKRVFAGLRELLARLSDRTLLILTIDDLQWADDDSIALLDEMLRGPDEPAVLLLGTLRSDAHAGLMARGLPKGATIQLAPLEAQDALALAYGLVQKCVSGDSIDLETVLREGAGHPLFLEELVRQYHQYGQPTRGLHLDDALRARAGQLPQQARQILDVVAVASAPMTQAAVARAAMLSFAEFSSQVKHLKGGRFVRTIGGTRGTDRIEPYHDRIREAISAELVGSARAELHRRIALVLESTAMHDPEPLAVHWREAGEPLKAAHYAELGGDKAKQAFAFRHAAHLYEAALSALPARGSRTHAVRVKLADALVNSGFSERGARVYQEAADEANATERLSLRTKAAEQLLRSGHMDEGMRELQSVLSSVGMSMPPSPERAMVSFLWGRARLKLRGLRYTQRREQDVKIELLVKVDICWAASVGLSLVNTIQGLDFQVRHLHLALDAGEPMRVVRALTLEALSGVSLGGPARAQGRELLRKTGEIAREAPTSYAAILVIAIDGAMDFMTGCWKSSYDKMMLADSRLRDECTGVTWEIANGRRMYLWCLGYMGKLQDLVTSVRGALRETLDVGDHNAASAVRSGFPNVVWLIADDPAGARRDADDVMRHWPRKATHLQYVMDLVAQTQIDLYEGAYSAAFSRVRAALSDLRRSVLPRVQLTRLLVTELVGRTAVGHAAHLGGGRKALAEASRAAKDIEAEEMPWSAGFALLVRAQIAAVKGRRKGMNRWLAEGVVAFDLADMTLHAMVCRFFHGKFNTGPAAESDLQRADEYFTREKVVNPERFALMFAPGFSRLLRVPRLR